MVVKTAMVGVTGNTVKNISILTIKVFKVIYMFSYSIKRKTQQRGAGFFREWRFN